MTNPADLVSQYHQDTCGVVTALRNVGFDPSHCYTVVKDGDDIYLDEVFDDTYDNEINKLYRWAHMPNRDWSPYNDSDDYFLRAGHEEHTSISNYLDQGSYYMSWHGNFSEKQH
jgi:hypothetical protein